MDSALLAASRAWLFQLAFRIFFLDFEVLFFGTAMKVILFPKYRPFHTYMTMLP